MPVIDSHFHWWPHSVFKTLAKRSAAPMTKPNTRGGHTCLLPGGGDYVLNSWAEWHDLDAQLAEMDRIFAPRGEKNVGVVCSIGPFSVFFSSLPKEEGRDLAIQWNEEMASAQRRYPGRVWASAAIPMQDTGIALEVLEDAVGRLGLMGVNIPGSIGRDGRIDAERLEPFYARLSALGLPAFLHPTDALFNEMLDGYGGALFLSLGRVMEVSVAASRLVLSGMMERHPGLKLVLSHTGGALPYQSGRMDKNTKAAKLPKPASAYLKRMYTDTVSPHAAGMRFAIEYYGIDQVMFGTDYPCWDVEQCLSLIDSLGLGPDDTRRLFYDNAVRILGLDRATSVSAAAE